MIAIVGAGAAGLATAIFAARRGAERRDRALRRGGPARGEDPGERRLALQRHERRRDGGATSAARPPHLVRRVLRASASSRPSPSSARSASRCTRRSTASSSRTRTARASSCEALLDEAAPAGRACCARGSASSRSRPQAGGFRLRTAKGDARGRAGRARDRRPLPAEDGQRRPRPRDRARRSATRSCRRRRPSCRSSSTGSFHAPPVGRGARGRADAVRAAGRTLARRTRLAALDALRRERPGGARRVARLAAGAARGRARRCSRRACCPGRDFEALEREIARLAAARPAARRRARARRAGSRAPWRRRSPREAGCRRTRRSAGCAARTRRALVARPRRAAAAGRGQPGLRLRRGHRGRRAARRGRHARRWSRGGSRGLFLVGEMLDVDGRIGGFNFQWAWSSAWVAAGGLAREPCGSLRAGRGGRVPAYRYRRPGPRAGRRLPLLRAAAGGRARRRGLRAQPRRTARSRSSPRATTRALADLEARLREGPAFAEVTDVEREAIADRAATPASTSADAQEPAMNLDAQVEALKPPIRDVPDFPKPGIVFKDITTLLQRRRPLPPHARPDDASVRRPRGRQGRRDREPRLHPGRRARRPARRRASSRCASPGKLPWKARRASYELEYGTDTLEMHEDALGPAERVLVVDDVIATGGTARAVGRARRGARRARSRRFAFLVELGFLDGPRQAAPAARSGA